MIDVLKAVNNCAEGKYLVVNQIVQGTGIETTKSQRANTNYFKGGDIEKSYSGL